MPFHCLPGCIRTFKYGEVLWRLPQLQIVRVSQLHLVVAVPAQQLVHGVFRKVLRHKTPHLVRPVSEALPLKADAVVTFVRETLEVALVRNTLSNN